MKRLTASIAAIAIAMASAQPASAFKIEAPRFIKDAVDKVFKPQPIKVMPRPGPSPIVRPLPNPRPMPDLPVGPAPIEIIVDDFVDLGEKAGEQIVDFAHDVSELKANAQQKIGEAIYITVTDPERAWDAVKDTATDAWDGVSNAANITFGMSPEERMAIARAAYESVEPLIPLLTSFGGELEAFEDRKAIVEALLAGDTERAARMLPRLTKFDEAMAAADAYGFKTVTIGIGADGSLAVGVVGEIGIAIDVENALADRPEDGARAYITYGLTAGASAGGDGTIGIGMWRATPAQIAGDTWGIVGAAASGPYGGSAGLWFAPDTEQFAGAGDLSGVTVGGSVGVSVEVGELNYTRTRFTR